MSNVRLVALLRDVFELGHEQINRIGSTEFSGKSLLGRGVQHFLAHLGVIRHVGDDQNLVVVSVQQVCCFSVGQLGSSLLEAAFECVRVVDLVCVFELFVLDLDDQSSAERV